MAFHPFRTFRKHKKVMFALLTIMCMLTFVLCAGYSARQEFFGKLLTDLISLIYQERWAPPVLCVALVLVALLSFFTARKQDDTTRSVTYYATAGGAVLLAVAVAVGIFLTREGKGAVTLYGKTVPEKTIAEVARKREIAKEVLTAAVKLGAEEIYNESRNAAGQKPGAELIQLRIYQKQQRLARADWHNLYYFSSKEPGENKLDYLVWQHQADLLGITLTNAAIDAEVRRYTADTADMRKVLSQLTHSYRVQDVYAALRDEFRLRIAQETLLGFEMAIDEEKLSDFRTISPFEREKFMKARQSPGLTIPEKVPEPFAPFDFWTYYRHNLTSYHVAFLPVAVEDFVPKVAGSPAEDVRMNLYKRFKDWEKDPLSDRQGIKQPRRIGVEWVSGKADTPHYRDSAEFALAVCPYTLPLAYQANLYDTYERQTDRYDSYERQKSPLFREGFLSQLQDATAAFGQPLGTAGAPGAVTLAVLVNYQAKMLAAQTRDKEQLAGALLLTGSDPIANAVIGLTYRVQYLPMSAVQKYLHNWQRLRLAQSIVTNDLMSLQRNLQNRGAKTPEEVVAAYFKERGLPISKCHGVTAKPRSVFDIAEDPELKALKEACQRFFLLAGIPKTEFTDRLFGSLFFDPTPKYDVKPFPPAMTRPGEEVSLDKNERWKEDPEPFLYWKTDDQKARVPSFEQAREEIDKTWRFLEAQKLARKKAEELRKEAESLNGDLALLKNLAAGQKKELIELESVALQVTNPGLQGPGTTYSPYRFPPDKLPNHRPEKELLNDLSKLHEPGKTTEKIWSDNAESTFYVVVLIARNEPSPVDFHVAYANSNPWTRGILSQFEEKQRQQFRTEVLKQLYNEAGLKTDDKGNIQIGEETRKALGVSTDPRNRDEDQ